MIAVIADDLTGAAEIGGIALRYGFRPKIVTADTDFPETELLIIDADTRSGSEQDAVNTTIAIGTALRRLQPETIFKKTDSVLRGHVLQETRALVETLGLRNALIVPGNPSLGRTVVNGAYFVYGQPIHETGFSDDPEFPIKSHRIEAMLRANSADIRSGKPTGDLEKPGIVIGDVETVSDLDAWAEKPAPGTLKGGGSGFFDAILQSMSLLRDQRRILYTPEKKRLYICGTAFANSVEQVQASAIKGAPVTYLPESGSAADWAEEALALINERDVAVIAIPAAAGRRSPESIKTLMASAAVEIIQRTPGIGLLIEGGSTAAAVLRKLGAHVFLPQQEFSQGVIRMETETPAGLGIILKPGSYDWPPGIWNF